MLLIVEINRPLWTLPSNNSRIAGFPKFASGWTASTYYPFFTLLCSARALVHKTLHLAQCTGVSHGSSISMPWVASNPCKLRFLGLGWVKNWAPPFSSGDNFVFRYFLHNLQGALRLIYSLPCTYTYRNAIAWLKSYRNCVDWGQLCQISVLFPCKSCLFKYEFACKYSINKL